MKIAELFAELGFKIEGKDELKGFETSLQNIANAARQAALALKDLAAARIPRQITIQQGGAQGQTARQPRVLPGMLNFIGPVQPPAYGGAPPPLLSKGAPSVSATVLQGLKSLGLLGLKVLGIATVAVALKKLVSALTDMVKTSMQATFAVDKFTAQTGMSRRELKEWERVAELSDVKTEDLQETLKSLQQRSRQIQMTGEGMNAFYGLLGISPHDNPTTLLKNFAARTKGMDMAQAVFLGSQIGIGESMVYMLRKNADRLGQMIPNGELSDRDQASVMALNGAWKDLMFTLGLLRDKLVADIAPAITWVTEQISIWAKVATGSKPVRDWLVQGGPTNPIGTAQLLMNMRSGASTKVENNVSVSIDGSKSPQETAKATSQALRRELSDSYYGRPPPWSFVPLGAQ